MEINSFRRLDEEPQFPKWPQSTKSKHPIAQIFGVLVGLTVWIFLISVFLITAYLYWFQKNLIIILKAVKPGHYAIAWWVSVLIFIFFMPITLLIIVIGTIIQLIKTQ